MKRLDIAGERFGNMVALHAVSYNPTFWRFKCDYELKNCRWATPKEQTINRRNVRKELRDAYYKSIQV